MTSALNVASVTSMTEEAAARRGRALLRPLGRGLPGAEVDGAVQREVR